MEKRYWKKLARWLVVPALLLALGALAPRTRDRAWAQGNFLADRHQGRGAKCDACHKESPPKGAGVSEACLRCHGNLEKVAAKTVKVKPVNPHASHIGEVACDLCHKGHNPSVNACAECHPFEFKVP